MRVIGANIYVVPTGLRRAVLLEIETSQGISGIGEAGIAYGVGTEAAAAMVRAMIERFVLNQDPGRIELIWNRIYDGGFWTKGGSAIVMAALSSIEQALWDIKGKALGVPVHDLLGGALVDPLPVYANGWWLGCATKEEYAAAAAGMVERGFRRLKLYPLGVPDPDTVVRHPVRRSLDAGAASRVHNLVACIREQVGPDVELMLDFGGGLTTDQVLRVLRRLEPLDILFVEEPIDPALTHVLPRIGQATRISIAAGERVYTRYGFHQLLQTGVVPIIQPDVCNTGGILEAKKIAAMAEVHNARVAPHNYGSALATFVAAQLSTCIPNFMLLECFPDHQSEPGYRPVVHEPLEAKVSDGAIPIPTAPGLGAGLDSESVAPFHWARAGG